MLIRVKTSFPLFSFGVLEINPITDFVVAQLCISAESAPYHPIARRTHSNSMPSLMRAELHRKPDRPNHRSPLPGSPRPLNPADTQLVHHKSRSTLSSPSRRQRNSPCTVSLPPSPKVTASAKKETPSTPSRAREYSPLTPSASVSSFGTGSFAFPTPRTPPKSKRSVLFLVIHICPIYNGT